MTTKKPKTPRPINGNPSKTLCKPREAKLNPKKPLALPTPWEGLLGPSRGLSVDLTEYEGFVYLILHKKTGKGYIGRKYLWSNTRVKVAGRKNRKRKKTESNWRHYKSSSADVKEAICTDGLDSFRFIILHWCKTRRETNYRELEEQVKRDVLSAKLPCGDWKYWNANILSRYFRGVIPEEEGDG